MPWPRVDVVVYPELQELSLTARGRGLIGSQISRLFPLKECIPRTRDPESDALPEAPARSGDWWALAITPLDQGQLVHFYGHVPRYRFG